MKLSEERLEEIRQLTWEWQYENCEDHQRAVDDLLQALEAKSKALMMMAESVADGLSHITALEAELEEARDEADCRDEELEEEREGHRLTGNRLDAALKALRQIVNGCCKECRKVVLIDAPDCVWAEARAALAATEEGKGFEFKLSKALKWSPELSDWSNWGRSHD